MLRNTTPRSDGFRMPGEFEKQTEIYMLWPYRADIWRCGGIYAQPVFAQVANAIAEFQDITVGVMPTHFEDARGKLSDKVRVIELKYNDCWMRDSGPTFVINDRGDIRGIDWKFNAWGGLLGGLYFPWDSDDHVASRILEMERLDRYRTEDFILEGGSIHTDGEGTLLTTKECLLNINRNSHMTQVEIEDMLKEYLAVDKIIWLNEGLYNDETNGHIDNICCFARPGEVILSYTDDPNHPSYQRTQEALKVLEAATDAKGRSFAIHKLYLPEVLRMSEAEYAQIVQKTETACSTPADLLPASYVNFLIINGAIIFPVFGDPMDEKAIELMTKVFPERKIVPIHSREIIMGGGNVHCITQQRPKP